VKSPCGGPPTASTPTTHDQPEQDNCPQHQPSGNTTSTEVSPVSVDGGRRVVEVQDFIGSMIGALTEPEHAGSVGAACRWAPVVGSQLGVAVNLVRQFHNRLHQGIPVLAVLGRYGPSPPPRQGVSAHGRRRPTIGFSSGGTMESSVPYTTSDRYGDARYILGYRVTVFQQRTYGQERVVNLSH
jgi:hypothetical protein